MRRLDVIQLAIIIVGIFVLYKFFTGVPNVLFSLLTWANNGLRGGEILEAFLGTFVLYSFYFAAAFICIKKSKYLANWICDKGDFSAAINLAIDKSTMLHIVFVAIGVYGIIENLPELLVTAFTKIKSNNSFMEMDVKLGFSTEDIIIKLLLVLMYFALVYYASFFATYLAAKINNTEPDEEITENKAAD